ncbi:hypothetical protein [Streptosporangium subroseum]|uniref:hypothetical protein n=1 Tax=Streptosporangium subroseum TaxID=106412 RepID=UPI001C52D948|nr:hypothetical protein [Streptosporangium subroseum]
MPNADAAYDEKFFEEYCADDFVAVGNYGICPGGMFSTCTPRGPETRSGCPNYREETVRDPSGTY